MKKHWPNPLISLNKEIFERVRKNSEHLQAKNLGQNIVTMSQCAIFMASCFSN